MPFFSTILDIHGTGRNQENPGKKDGHTTSYWLNTILEPTQTGEKIMIRKGERFRPLGYSGHPILTENTRVLFPQLALSMIGWLM